MDGARFQLGSNGFRIDLLRRRVVLDGQSIALCPREMDLLAYLFLRYPAIASRTDLLRHVCNLRIDPGTNVIEVHLSRLRAKLRECGGANVIETVRGEGYRLAIPQEKD